MEPQGGGYNCIAPTELDDWGATRIPAVADYSVALTAGSNQAASLCDSTLRDETAQQTEVRRNLI